jgi:DCN1-like protein 1/2
MIFTQSNEKTALTCLSQNDWKLDVSTDNFFQNPDLDHPNLKGVLDKKRLEQLYNRYRGKCHLSFHISVYAGCTIIIYAI